MDRYLVFGNPVSHSLSPRIHAAFAAQTGQTLSYDAREAPLDGFADCARAAFADGLAGANVTVPFKADAHAIADRVDARAERAGVVNTLRREPDGTISAFNTDGLGLVADLRGHLGFDLRGARVRLLGAGGAARGVVQALLEAGVAELMVSNRTPARASALAGHFRALGPVRMAREAEEAPTDLVINATSASLAAARPGVSDSVLAGATLVYDMMYGPRARPFLEHASALGADATSDGLGMLVEQAAEAFALWRGVRPQTKELLAELRAEVSGH